MQCRKFRCISRPRALLAFTSFMWLLGTLVIFRKHDWMNALRTQTQPTAVSALSARSQFSPVLPGTKRPVCAFGWRQVGHRCYLVVPETLHRSRAVRYCTQRGGHLATIRDKDEAVAVCEELAVVNNQFIGELHIGLCRLRSGRYAAWDNGERYTELLAWQTGHGGPSKSARSCALLRCDPRREYFETSSDAEAPFACSKPAEEIRSLGPLRIAEDAQSSETEQNTPKWWHEGQPPRRVWKSGLAECCNYHHINHNQLQLTELPVQLPWANAAIAAAHPVTSEGEESASEEGSSNSAKQLRLSGKYRLSVWQSKLPFGYGRYWTSYLTEQLGFVHAGDYRSPAAAALASSAAGNDVNGGNQEVHAIFSRLVVPSAILSQLRDGVLVNQIYTNPDTAGRALGEKVSFTRALRRFQERHGCVSGTEDSWPFPQTFDFSNALECNEFFDRLRSGSIAPSDVFVVKGPLHGGKDVQVLTASRISGRSGVGTAPCQPTSLHRNETVQRYIANPLLLDGRKFDVRFFLLVASTRPLVAFVFNTSYARASVLKFTDPASSRNAARHVTNTKVQMKVFDVDSKKDWERHILSPARIARYARVNPTLREDFIDHDVLPSVRRALQLVLAIAADTIGVRRSGQWQLFGTDFVLDNDLRPWLVDINAFPGWGWTFRTPWALNYRKRMMRQMWQTILDVQMGRSSGHSTPRSGGWQLIYNEG